MTVVVACVLVLDGWAAVESTLASIRRLGVNAAAGLIGDGQGPEPEGVEVHRLEWRDDFGHARNQLAEKLTAAKLNAEWLLWLNDDEDLIAFAEPQTDAPHAGVWIEDDAAWTARMAVRLQRRGRGRWSGALHETLSADEGGEAEVLDGIRLQRRDRRRGRLRRHHDMVSRGCLGYGATLAEARHARETQPTGQDFMLWLRAYKEAAKTPLRPVHPDPRVEPAIRLCDHDFIKPALALAEEQPAIVGLQYAILRSDLVTKKHPLDRRVKVIAQRLAEGRIDRRYSFRLGLEDKNPRHVRYALHAGLIGEFDRSVSKHQPGETVYAGRYRIVPVADISTRPGRYRIRLEAGLTFGTGKHPATQGALAAIDRLARRRNFRRVLDFGCGSGILGIAAAKAWPARIFAYDINPVAAEQARRNVTANGLGGRVRARTTYGLRDARLPRGESYDLEVFNLDAKHLTRYGAALCRRLAPGGVVVITGFAVNEEPRIISHFRSLGLRMRAVHRYRTWSTMILEDARTTTRRATRPRIRCRRARR